LRFLFVVCKMMTRTMWVLATSSLLLVTTERTFGQAWQEYQLTHYPPNRGVMQLGAAADSLGNVHIYYSTIVSVVSPEQYPLFYIRVSPYGQILTDTTRLTPARQVQHANYVSVTGDGRANSWCLWSDDYRDDPDRRGILLTGRNVNGEEILPPTVVSNSGGSASPDEEFKSVYRDSDHTIHSIRYGIPYRYSVVTTTGDTLISLFPIPEMLRGAHCSIALAPDNSVWVAARNTYANFQTDLVFCRFEHDTTYSVYYPFGYHTGMYWDPYTFTIDNLGSFHCLVYDDTCQFSYCKLTSDFSVQTWHILRRTSTNIVTAMSTDPSTSCVVIWVEDDTHTMKWCKIDSLGMWAVSPENLQNNILMPYSASAFSMGRDQWAVVWAGAGTNGTTSDLRLLTYHLQPGSSVGDQQNAPNMRRDLAYPNPFSASLTVNVPDTKCKAIIVYDILGRTIYNRELSPGLPILSMDPSVISQLPSGTYFARFEGIINQVPIKLIHIK
jgi:hypothetical protein